MKKNALNLSNTNSLIIQGDNLIALKALLPSFEGQIRCIYIDPPYNNGERFKYYNDNQPEIEWCKMMSSVLKLLWRFLSKNGSIWISIDDNELHYLKVLADKVLGRENFINTIVWQQRTTRENRTVFSPNNEFILVYAKNPISFKESRNLLPLPADHIEKYYSNPDNDPRGPWQSVSMNVQDGHAVPTQYYPIITPSGRVVNPPKGRCWIYNEERFIREKNANNIWFGPKGNGVPRVKKFLADCKKGLTPETLWLGDFAGTTKDAKEHIRDLFHDDELFETPKPEKLISRILAIATNNGDYVLDCFLGSGSTISTAHKMGRNYIGIEINPQTVKLIDKRMKMVVEGEQGGISSDFNWQGGGDYSIVNL